MNHTYRIVFNRSAGLWQVASEHARGQGKGGCRRSRSARGRLPLMAVLLMALGAAAEAQAGPMVTLTGDTTFGPYSGPGLTVLAPLSVGISGVGTLTVADGGLLTLAPGNTLSLADSASAHGTINIGAATGAAPAGAGFLATSQLVFGAGTGTLNFNTSDVHDFGAALVSSGAGTHQLNHYAGTTRLLGDSSGFAGNTTVSGGNLQILNRLGTTEGRIDTGAVFGATAAVTVSGAGAAWENSGNVFVGGTGSGKLAVEAGGLVSNQFGTVNAMLGDAAEVTVSGAGARWLNSAALSVAKDGGKGTVSVRQGGYLSSTDGYIGSLTGSNGNVTVSGGTWSNAGFLRVGEVSGLGTLAIGPGGLVSNTDSYIGSMNGTGNVIVSGVGASWNNTGALNLGFGQSIIFGTGSLTIADAGTVNVGTGGTGVVALAKEGVFPGLGTTGTINIGGQTSQAAAAAGTLNASAIEFGKGNATLNFNHTDSGYRFLVPLKSTGNGIHQLNQLAGSTFMAGDSSGFKGVTKVSGGKLTVTGKLGGSADVSGGALQYGDGALGSANSLTGDLKVTGTGSTLSVQGPATLAVAGDVNMADNTVLDIGAGSGAWSLQAGSVTLGNGVAFKVSGIHGTSRPQTILIDTSTGISGDFGSVSVGGFAGAVDYISVRTSKSADNRQYLASLDLSWTASNASSHGTFTLSNPTDRFVVGVDLADQQANAATGWNGRSLTKAGAGTLVLSGNNTYSGGTTITGGTLQVGRDANLGAASGGLTLRGGTLATTASFDTARAVTLAQAGRFEVDAGTSLGLTGTVSGAGALSKSGAGTLILSGSNSYGGGTVISGGRLQVASDANLGAPSGGLSFNGGTLATTGSFDTARAVVLTGTGSFDVAANTTLGLNGALSGGGALVKNGAGTLRLSGDGSGFTGSTTVNSGRLALNGKLGGAISIGAGGVLGGVGTVGSGAGSAVTVTAGGTLSPGNSIGTLTIDGDLVVENGARFAVETNPQGSDADLVRVTGNARLNGGSVAHIGAAGNYGLRSVYTILSADGTLSGQFGSVTSDFAFLQPRLAYDYGAGRVSLELTRNGATMASAAATRNQRAAAGAIDGIGMTAGSRIYDAVALLPNDKELLRSSFDQLSGEIHASAQTVLMEDSRYVRDAASERLRSAAGAVGASSAPVLASTGNGAGLAAATVMGPASWIQGLGSWRHIDGDGNAAQVQSSTGGFLMGVDAPVSNAWRLGLMAGYSRTDFDVRDRSSSGDSDNYHLGAYGGGQWGALGLRGGLAYSWHDIATRRSVAMPGFADRLKANYDGGTTQAFADLSYRIDTPRVAFEPFASLAYVNLKTDGYTESGGAAALRAKGQTTETTFSTLGSRVMSGFELGGVQATVRGSLGWRYAFGDLNPLATQSFAVGQAFTVAGVPIAKNSAVIEAGLDLRISPTASFDLSYQGQIASSGQDHGVRAGLSIRF
ncbi:autotransporter domain-containing protein [Achromobacter aegrifaciens]